MLALAFGGVPVAADVVTVQPAPLPPLARDDTSETAFIRTLQQVTRYTFRSPISPDDQSVFVELAVPDDAMGSRPVLAFLNIQDGTLTPVENAVNRLFPLSNVGWRDANTAVLVALEQGAPVVALLARDTGKLKTEPLAALPGAPISLAPNGSRVLVASNPDGLLPVPDFDPFDITVPLVPGSPAAPALPATDATTGAQRWQATPAATTSLQVASNDIDLAVYDLVSGRTVPLTTLPAGSGLRGAPVWSPDGSRLAWVRDSVSPQFRGDSSLIDVVTQDALGQVPPASNPLLQGNVLDTFTFVDGEPYPVTYAAAADPTGHTFGGVAWSPDGGTLMARMLRPAVLAGRTFPIYSYPASSYLRFYAAADGAVVGTFDVPEVSAPNTTTAQFASPDEVIINSVFGMSRRIFLYNWVSGEFRDLSPQSGDYTQVLVTRATRQVVFAYSSLQTPPELYRLNFDGSELFGLTFENTAAARASRVQVNPLTFTLGSGAVRRGYLVQPATQPFPPQDVPLVVWQEGGPGIPMIDTWSTRVESPATLLPNLGISVLVLPLPGREGWGAAFYTQLADGDNFGSLDINEAAEVVAQLNERGIAAPQQVGISGCSYGGYFASQSAVRHPQSYAAANPQCSLLDMITEWQTGFTPLMAYLTGASPTTAPETYLRVSPGFHAADVQTPTLFFHGTRDFLPLGVVETFYGEIAQQGTPVRLVRFVDEGHGLQSPASQARAAQEQLAWFREHLAQERVPLTPDAPPAATPSAVVTAGVADTDAARERATPTTPPSDLTRLTPTVVDDELEQITPRPRGEQTVPQQPTATPSPLPTAAVASAPTPTARAPIPADIVASAVPAAPARAPSPSPEPTGAFKPEIIRLTGGARMDNPPTATAALPTATPTPTTTATPTPTTTATPTPTTTATPTAMPTATPTLTATPGDAPVIVRGGDE